jgi:hypothetical protein
VSAASLSKQLPEECLSRIDFSYCINTKIFCPRSNEIDHISEEFLNRLNKQVKIVNVHATGCKDARKTSQLIFESYLIDIFLSIHIAKKVTMA